MNFRPAGFSSDEEDEYEQFSFHGETKSEKQYREEIAAEIYNERLKAENTTANRVYKAILKGNVDQIAEELKSGFDVNSFVSSDWTALFLAATQCNVDVVNVLLSNGADVKLTRDGITPLMAVCNCLKDSTSEKDVLSVVKLLIEYGADVNAIDRKRKTAFMYACAQGFLEVVTFMLPLVNLEEKDNQGWTALFHAVNENEVHIVDYLVKSGSNVEIVDIRNNDIKYYATLNDYTDIIDILPKSDFDIGPEDFSHKAYNYETIFESLNDNERPDFKEDIAPLLFGMKCQNFIPMFNKLDIDLLTFLTLNEQNLKDLGISMQYQRNRILQGLYNFHKRAWSKRSIPLFQENENFTSQDVFVTIANTIKHLIVLEAAIKYLNLNFDFKDENIKKNIIKTKTIIALRKINRFKVVINKLQQRALHYDLLHPGEADLITNKTSFSKNMLNKKVALLFTGLASIYFFRFIKNTLV